jgi:hypothetical protein
MTFLPERHRSPPPQRWEGLEGRRGRPLVDLDGTEWRIAVKREPRFGNGILYALCIAAGVWLVWPAIRDVILPRPIQPYAPPAQAPGYGAPQPPAYGPGRYARPLDPVDPDFSNWGNRNHSGVVPRDVFGFLGDGRKPEGRR